MLKKLPEVIANSIEAEVHPDRIRGEDGRSPKSNINRQSLIHRFYGAVEIDGAHYRVKTTIREYADENRTSKAHNYEVTKLELLEAPSTGGVETSGEPLAMTSNNSISGAKLLQGVEKSYDKGKNLLDESKKSAMFRESEDEMLDRLVDEMGYFAALARKTMKGGGYSKKQRETYARAEWRRAHRNAEGIAVKHGLKGTAMHQYIHSTEKVEDIANIDNETKGYYSPSLGMIIVFSEKREKLKSDRLLYKATALDESAPSSAEQPINEVGSPSSEAKDTDKPVNTQGNGGENIDKTDILGFADRIAKREKERDIQTAVAHFPMETPRKCLWTMWHGLMRSKASMRKWMEKMYNLPLSLTN